MTNRPIETGGGDVDLPDQVPANPETDTDGKPQAERDQPAEVETGDVAEEPTNPPEDPGVDPPKETDELRADPTQVAEKQSAEEPAGGQTPRVDAGEGDPDLDSYPG